MKKHWKYAILGLLIAGFAVAYLIIPKHPIGPLLTVPNGYEDLRKAADIAEPGSRTFSQLEDEELRSLVVHGSRSEAEARSPPGIGTASDPPTGSTSLRTGERQRA